MRSVRKLMCNKLMEIVSVCLCCVMLGRYLSLDWVYAEEISQAMIILWLRWTAGSSLTRLSRQKLRINACYQPPAISTLTLLALHLAHSTLHTGFYSFNLNSMSADKRSQLLFYSTSAVQFVSLSVREGSMHRNIASYLISLIAFYCFSNWVVL